MPFIRIKSNMCLLVGCAIVLSGWARAGEAGLEGHPAIAVPDEHVKLGQVFYVVSTKAPHVTFRSNAKNEKFQGTSGKLSGYVVAPRGGEVPPAQLAAGKFRLAVTSLDTGNSSK